MPVTPEFTSNNQSDDDMSRSTFRVADEPVASLDASVLALLLRLRTDLGLAALPAQ